MSKTECSAVQLELEGLGRRRVVAEFSSEQVSSDAGGLLLREVDRVVGVLDRFAGCFTDYRDPERVEHSVRDLLAQRVLGLALGYDDLNDHDLLRHDGLLAVLVGKLDPTGSSRRREADRGNPLSGRNTLNRLELARRDSDGSHRYHKVVCRAEAVEQSFVDLYLDSQAKQPKEIVIDLDATDDPLHGHQEGRFFHGYYGHYCYLPLYIFVDGHLLAAKLRPANIDASAGALEEIQRIVERIRSRWQGVRIVLRADSGFARDRTMTWCEANGVHYVFGLARNQRLEQMIADDLERSRRRSLRSGKASRRYRNLAYRTRNSWSCPRRVVAKAEHLPGRSNPRFVVTSLSREEWPAWLLYERLYCARGDMENRIKEQQLGLFADRTSSSVFFANQIRLWLSSIAYVLMHALRTIALAGTTMARAQCWTIRERLLKIGAIVAVSVRRVRFLLPVSCPFRSIFLAALRNIHAARAAPA